MSSEYGWSDEQIGELPLGRFRQITATIQLRRFGRAREENGRYSWLARNLAAYIAAGYQMGKNQENVALKQAGSLAFDDIEVAFLEAEAEKPKENKKGSFERFMAKMGNGMSRP